MALLHSVSALRLALAAAVARASPRCIHSQPRRPELRKLLVANRGEIACRVLATARRLGVPTVAVYSEADRSAAFVAAADEAYCIGPAPARDSYLRGDVILDVALRAGADAVHPGYGFLSENADFAEACAAAGVTFVGPPPDAIRAMGDKARAKTMMSAAGVPVVPGYHGDDQEDERLAVEAMRVGFPLLVKAVAGGGGKGMKLAASEAELSTAIASARREAAAAVGNDRLLLERYVTRPRHVEVQVMADGHGDVVYLFDRDCSVQRRHQKIIEEAPAPGLPQEFHTAIGEAAVRAARAVGYRSAGTVEFIVDADSNSNEHYFLEMNTRLQVEHPVTEAVTGLDLVELQLRIAAGESLSNLGVTQQHLTAAGPRGHSLEARLYAESTRRGFLPGAGRVLRWKTPAGAATFDPCAGASIRVDSGVREGDAVGTHYDPMIAKIISHGPDRAAALAALRHALAETQVAGLPTNLRFLQDLAAHPAFLDMDLDTGFIERHRGTLLKVTPPPLHIVGIAAALWVKLLADAAAAAAGPVALRGSAMGAWAASDAKRLWHDLVRPLTLRDAESDADMRVQLMQRSGTDYEVVLCDTSGAPPVIVRELRLHGNSWEAEVDGAALRGDVLMHAASGQRVLTLWLQGRSHEFRAPLPTWSKDAGGAAAASPEGGAVCSPLPGRITKLLAAEGDTVAAGAPLVIIEAMKMEHTLRAPSDGVIGPLAAGLRAGAQVEDGQLLLTVLPLSTASAVAEAQQGQGVKATP